MAEHSHHLSQGLTVVAVPTAVVVAVPLALVVALVIYLVTLLALAQTLFGLLAAWFVPARSRPVAESR